MRSRSASSTDDPTAIEPTIAVGRFAPSPTGPLHLGSLLTAVASYVHTRSCGGRWLVRIDDLDVQRTIPGGATLILRTLDEHALHWDGTAIYQHDRIPNYLAALERLSSAGHTFACTCSRKQLTDGIYAGHCRHRHRREDQPHSVRLKVPAKVVRLHDAIQGSYTQQLDREVGDFVIRRRDGIIAYQLAGVVDDIDHQITHIVRGADLLDSTPRQLLLFERLGAPAPEYAHIPVLSDRTGRKLSKQTYASAAAGRDRSANLNLILALLGHEPPRQLQGAAPDELLSWAVQHWDLARVPRGIVLTSFVCT